MNPSRNTIWMMDNGTNIRITSVGSKRVKGHLRQGQRGIFQKQEITVPRDRVELGRFLRTA